MKSWMNCVSFAAWLNLQTIPVTGAICKIRNCSKTSELRTDTEVQKQVAALTESDFTRRVPRKRTAGNAERTAESPAAAHDNDWLFPADKGSQAEPNKIPKRRNQRRRIPK